MKKKLLLALTVCAMAFMAAACGSKDTVNETTTAAAEAETAETKKAQPPVKPDLSKVDPKEALGPGAFEEEEEQESPANMENQNLSDLEKTEYREFAKQVVDAVVSKDMEALADLMHYPVYVAAVEENGGMVDDKEAFLAQDPDVIFTEELIAAMENVDIEALEPVMAGVVIGEETPNVIVNSMDGTLGVMGINY